MPGQFAGTARLAQDLGFGGAQIHAAHGFLLSQFLSPLFNRRTDGYGGSLGSRARLLLEVIDAVRAAVDSRFVVAVKLNASDRLAGGFEESESLVARSATGPPARREPPRRRSRSVPSARRASRSAARRG